MEDNKFFQIDHEDDHIWITMDWVMLDWFKNYSRRMGIEQPEEQMVKALALSFMDEI